MSFKTSLLIGTLCLGFVLARAQEFTGRIALEVSWRPDRIVTLTMDGPRSMAHIQDPAQDRDILFVDLEQGSEYVLHSSQEPVRAIRFGHQSGVRTGGGLTFTNVQLEPETKMIGAYSCQRVSFLVQGAAGEAWVAAELASLEIEKHLSSRSGDLAQFLTVPGIEGIALEWQLPALANKPAQTATVTVEALNSVQIALPEDTKILDMEVVHQLLQDAQGDPVQEAAAQEQVKAMKAAFYQD
ncbi:MAG: hypothetical protein AAFV07_19655 [Bacteroidota bacterium]